jgi:hypothetical protein
MTAHQTTITPCGFCDEPSIQEVIVAPVDSSGTKPLKAWVCKTHLDAVNIGEGWQGRERKRKAAMKKELQAATDDARLFDPGPPKVQRDWEHS